MKIKPLMDRVPRGLATLVLGISIAACGTDTTGPEPSGTDVLTVDAASDWSFVRLGESAEPVTVVDRNTSTNWDLGFFSTSVMVNGGAAGPAGVTAYCVCQNQQLTGDQVQKLTAESQQAVFDAVTAADIPAADSAWQGDQLTAAISGWYSYNPISHTVSAATGRFWKVRTANGAAYAKVRISKLENPAREHAGQVTLEFAVQPSRGAAMGSTRSLTVDVSSGQLVKVDLESGSVTESADWDVALQGYTIRVNGGVSGAGDAGAVLVTDSFESATDASDLTDSHYRGDSYGGVFNSKPWYRYNITGTDHQIWPTYDVYLIKRGAEVYKVQIIGYYGPTGEARQIAFRYAQLAR